MESYQIIFLTFALAMLALGVINLFYTERYFFWQESRTYANPLEPSTVKLRSMRLGGTMQVMVAMVLAYLGIFG